MQAAMASWRDRGFVPDSDDEEDSCPAVVSNTKPEVALDEFRHVDELVTEVPTATAERYLVERTANNCKAQVNGPQEKGHSPIKHGTSVYEIPDSPGQDVSIRPATVNPSPSGVTAREAVVSDQALTNSGDQLATHGSHQREDGSVRTPPRLPSPGGSSSSSPLTELSASPNPPSSYAHLVHSSQNAPQDAPTTSFQEIDRLAGRLPSLRKRNPIQLHPYILEGERYRNFLKDRGLKPVRIDAAREVGRSFSPLATPEAEYEGSEKDNEESQAPRTNDESQDVFSIPSSPLPELSRQLHGTGKCTGASRALAPKNLSQEDELPDIDQIWDYRSDEVLSPKHKRRKTHHTSPQSHVPFRKPTAVLDFSSPISTVAVDVEPIPAASVSKPRHALLKAFEKSRKQFNMDKAEKGNNATAPEPLGSEVPSSRDDDLDLQSVLSISSTTSLESEPETSDESIEIRRVQKRIKGVLPASWLKLDLQQKPSKHENHHQGTRAKPPSSFRPGVARKRQILAARGTALSRSNQDSGREVDEFDRIPEDDYEEEDTQSHRAPIPEITDFYRNLDSADEDMEDNRVDSMLPSARRRPSTAPKQRSGHRRNPAASSGQHRALTTREYHHRKKPKTSHATRQTSIKDRLSQHSMPQSVQSFTKYAVPPKISILDSPGSPSDPSNPAPQFLRIAKRQARSRKDRGLQSPTRKLIKLSRRQDTEEVNSILRDWKRGKLQVPPPSVAGSLKTSQQYPPKTSRIRHPQSSSRPAITSRPGRPTLEAHLNPLVALTRSSVTHYPIIRKSDAKTAGIPAGPSEQHINHQQRTVRPDGRVVLRQNNPAKPKSSTHEPRPAQLESTAVRYSEARKQQSFRSKKAHLDRVFDKKLLNAASQTIVPLRRFLKDDTPILPRPGSAEAEISMNAAHDPVSIIHRKSTVQPRRARKRPPKHINVDLAEYVEAGRTRSPSRFQRALLEYPTTEAGSYILHTIFTDNLAPQGLRDFRPFGSQHTLDFDVLPLEPGTFFHPSTFIGSGDLALAFNTNGQGNASPETDAAAFGDVTASWGPWSQEVSEKLENVFGQVMASLDEENHAVEDRPTQVMADRTAGLTETRHDTATLLRSVSRYLATGLRFNHTDDKVAFMKKFIGLQIDLSGRNLATPSSGTSSESFRSSFKRKHVITQMYCLVISWQTLQLTRFAGGLENHEPLAKKLMVAVARGIVHVLKSATFVSCESDSPTDPDEPSSAHATLLPPVTEPDRLQEFYENNEQLLYREAGIRNDNHLVECWVVTMKVLDKERGPDCGFWEIAEKRLLPSNLQTETSVVAFDKTWYHLFALLPLMNFTEDGKLDPEASDQTGKDNWLIPRALISRVFTLYEPSLVEDRYPPRTVDLYLRSLYSRCFHLVVTWGWSHCEGIIGTLFDFFASRGLTHLPGEERSGPCEFLERLADDDKMKSLDVVQMGPGGRRKGDRCFHILLKIIAVGIKKMRSTEPAKKIQNIVFRLIPNHGRQYPKEEAIREEDFDALCNHHDLLSTLYWAAGPDGRPSLKSIADLVQPEISHRQACLVSLRAWSNLVRFQLSTDEPVAHLRPFHKWHRDLITQVIHQREVATTEANSQFESARAAGALGLSREVVEATIDLNQKQVDDVLIEALKAMRMALDLARNASAAIILLDTSSTVDILNLYSTKKPQTSVIVLEALEVLAQYIRTITRLLSQKPSQRPDDDSQEYGDWSAFDDSDLPPNRSEAADWLGKVVWNGRDGLNGVMKLAFSAKTAPDDKLLTMLIDTWASVVSFYVSGTGHDYMGFSRTRPWLVYAWTASKKSRQSIQFLPYILAKNLDMYPAVFTRHRNDLLSIWLASLVEWESRWKFQHTLTNAMLNVQGGDPVFADLPFILPPAGSLYRITLAELLSRRLSLISSILSNMRDHVALSTPDTAARLRKEYGTIIRNLMNAMKNNFEEIQTFEPSYGYYVNFVQSVVELLQEHTTEICPVDKYFTDSFRFPVPSMDPTYVVGRLKNYGSRLTAGPAVHKQLISFIYSITERAAIDNDQKMLAEQLTRSVSDTFESGDDTQPTLRAFFLEVVFPEYLNATCHSDCAWILTTPLLQSIADMFDQLLLDINIRNPRCVDAVEKLLNLTLDQLCRYVGKVSLRLGCKPTAMLAPELLVFRLVFRVLTSAVTPVGYLYRAKGRGGHAMLILEFFDGLAGSLLKVFTTPPVASDLTAGTEEPPKIEPPPELDDGLFAARWPHANEFCAVVLADGLGRGRWTRRPIREGESEWAYFVRQAKVEKEVPACVKGAEQERGELVRGLREFGEVWGRTKGARVVGGGGEMGVV